MTQTPLIAVPKYAKLGEGFSPREILKSTEDSGRPWDRVAGGWISDLVALQKFIMLCPFCLPKFNPKRHGYEVWRLNISSIGKCDGCKNISTYLQGFIPEAYHPILGDQERKPRRGRWSLKLRRD